MATVGASGPWPRRSFPHRPLPPVHRPRPPSAPTEFREFLEMMRELARDKDITAFRFVVLVWAALWARPWKQPLLARTFLVSLLGLLGTAIGLLVRSGVT